MKLCPLGKVSCGLYVIDTKQNVHYCTSTANKKGKNKKLFRGSELHVRVENLESCPKLN